MEKHILFVQCDFKYSCDDDVKKNKSALKPVGITKEIYNVYNLLILNVKFFLRLCLFSFQRNRSSLFFLLFILA